MLNIEKESAAIRFSLFQMGFRPFFLGACLYALFAVSLWMGIYHFQLEFDSLSFYQSLVNWHAHEMIFGYTMAVVAGFLLTAVKNWTGIQPADGVKLFFLFALWVMARVAPYMTASLLVVSSLDILFNLVLVVYLALPMVKARMWPNLSLIATTLLLLLAANLIFYLGLAGVIDDGVRHGIYAGIYLILALIFIMSRRVIPFFIEKALAGDIQLKNSKAIDIASLLFFLLYAIVDIISPAAKMSALLAGMLVVIHSIRLAGWHTRGIWKEPLLWVLYSAYLWIIFGFVLKLATLVFSIPTALDIHAYAYGGIGLMTIGMMARISLGHSGRSIYNPPKLLTLIFSLMIAGSFLRVIFPLFFSQFYIELIAAAQILWLLAYTLFLVIYLPILTKPRIDGQAG